MDISVTNAVDTAVAVGFKLNAFKSTELGEWLVRTLVISLAGVGVSIRSHQMGLKNSAHAWAQFITLMLSVFCSYVYRIDSTADDGKLLRVPIVKPLEMILWEGIIFWLVAAVAVGFFDRYLKDRLMAWLDRKLPRLRGHRG